MSAARLDVRELGAAYGGVAALRDVSLTIEEGEIVAVLGANGAGKSTLMHALIGLIRSTGDVRLDGRSLGRMPANRRARSGLGYCPEGRRVFPAMTVGETLELANWEKSDKRRERMGYVYTLFPQLRERASALAWQLSGGEQQMLAIGRALMTGPKVLLLDEPVLGLAPRLAADVFEALRAIAANGMSVLLAEQNAARTLQIADRAYVLKLGRIVGAGNAASLAKGDLLREAYLGL